MNEYKYFDFLIHVNTVKGWKMTRWPQSDLFEKIKIIFQSVPIDDLERYSSTLFSRLFDYQIPNSKGALKYDACKVSSFLFLIRFTEAIQADRQFKQNKNIKKNLEQITNDILDSLHILANSKVQLNTILMEAINMGSFQSYSHDLALQFQNLIPLKIRKHIAAYYTKQESARLLAFLAFDPTAQRIADFACGAAILLQESIHAFNAYNQPFLLEKDAEHQNGLISQTNSENLGEHRSGNYNEKCKEKVIFIFGSDILSSALLLSKLNLSTIFSSHPFSFELKLCDALTLENESELSPGVQLGTFDLIIENPPFTRTERISDEHHETFIQKFVESKGLRKYYSKRMGLQALFLMHADSMLNDSGTLAFVLPANIFNIDTKIYLQNFFIDKKYHIRYAISLSSNEFAFSEDCNYKEILLIAKKGHLDDSVFTKFVQISKLPTLEQCFALAEKIKTSNISFSIVDSIDIKINIIKTVELLSANRKWDSYFWNSYGDQTGAILDFSACQSLVPLSKSGEFSVRVGFHSTYSDLLIFPNEYFDISLDQNNSDGFILIRKEDGKSIKLAQTSFARAMRESKLYTKFIEQPSHYVFIHSEGLNAQLAEDVLGYLSKQLKIKYEKKIEKGGSAPEALDPQWYKHPTQTGALYKRSKLFTFNRYGLWKRTNLCVYTQQEATANDGFHLYSYIGKVLDEDEALLLLCSWFNSSLHIYDFFMKCRVPAKHVQQVSLSDRKNMLVPSVKTIDAATRKRILKITHVLNERLPIPLIDQFDLPERKELDMIWLEALDIEREEKKKDQILQKLYVYLKELLRSR